jgi:hypothetical protein
MVFINSKDDPLVHPSLLSIPENFVGELLCLSVQTLTPDISLIEVK